MSPGIPRLPDGEPPDMVFVDLDGTLVDLSTEKLLLARLVRSGSIGTLALLGFLLAYALHPARTLRQGKGWNRTYLRGLGEGDLVEQARGVGDEIAAGRMRPWTRGAVEGLSGAGCRTVIMTASLEPLAGSVVRDLPVDLLVASRPEVRGGRLTGRLDGPRPWGRNKRELAAEECRRSGIPMERCMAAGDSWSDRFVMQACGGAVAVCPDRRLLGLAREHGWTVPVGGEHARWA